MTVLIRYSPKHTIVKRNVACAYCDVALASVGGGEKEHVIGRRFVPKGSLSGQWNLVLQSCPDCNDAKADLEDDISAITIQPDARGRYAVEEEGFIAEAKRKAQTRNRRTKRRVSEPTPPIAFKGAVGPMQVGFSFRLPAQPDVGRMFELARLQLTGFFSLLTYDEGAQRGHFWTSEFAPVVIARKEDWGHPHLGWVEAVSRSWEYRLHAITAEGFYKAWIRRRLGEPAVWAWALEWNRNFRLAGFFGDPDEMGKLLAGQPTLDAASFHEGRIRIRFESPLADEDDTMFDDPLDQGVEGVAV